MKRNETRTIKVGNLTIGGNNEVIIQSMTNTKTKNIEATSGILTCFFISLIARASSLFKTASRTN